MMPSKNRAQQKYFEYLESKGKMPKYKYEGGMAHMQHGEEELPHHEEMMPKYAYGGMVNHPEDEHSYSMPSPRENPDYEQGHMDEFDSAGEPHTEDKKEDEQPMEYMSHGGRVKRMAKGGMVHNSKFARALRKGY